MKTNEPGPVFDGGAAFPATRYWNQQEMGYRHCAEGGMSLRDYFAAAALHPVIIVFLDDDLPKDISAPEFIAHKCYQVADAMLAQRAKK